MKKRSFILFALVAMMASAACSTTKSLRDGEYLLRSNKIKVDSKEFNASELSSYITQTPNAWILGTSPQLAVYNWGGFFKRLGEPPVVYNPSKVDESIENITNHLRYIGFYGSQVESDIGSASARFMSLITWLLASATR